jgi:tRNA G37 N-methylase TrmD
MNGVEQNSLEECNVGDWVLCGGEFRGSTILFINDKKRSDIEVIQRPDSKQFDRIWVEPLKVITAWMRMK